MPRVLETIRRLDVNKFVVRVWMAGHQEPVHDEIEAAIDHILRSTAVGPSVESMATYFADLHPAINAVEVVEAGTGRGALVYPDWP